jgi:hypothetical protein
MKVMDPHLVAGPQVLCDHIGIAFVDGAVELPITAPHQRLTEAVVEHRPQRAVRVALVVTGHFRFRERHR